MTLLSRSLCVVLTFWTALQITIREYYYNRFSTWAVASSLAATGAIFVNFFSSLTDMLKFSGCSCLIQMHEDEFYVLLFPTLRNHTIHRWVSALTDYCIVAVCAIYFHERHFSTSSEESITMRYASLNKTLNQTCRSEIRLARGAFEDLMTRGILQFALLFAFRCVLHRCGNQDIHRWKFS